MIRLERAKSQAQYDELLDLIPRQTTTRLQPQLDWVQLTHADFGAYFRATGAAYRVCWGSCLVGLIWVEQTGETLLVRGIIIKPEAQGQGFGRWALERIEKRYCRRVRRIALDVHASNPRARSLYERLGFQVTGFDAQSGFYRMQKTLPREEKGTKPHR